MGLEDRLSNLAKEQAAADAAEQAEVDAAKQATAQGQIDQLQAERATLATALDDLKSGYKEGQEALTAEHEAGQTIVELHQKYEPVLKKQGIDEPTDLLRSSDFSGEEEVQNFRTAEAQVRSEVEQISAAKEKLQEHMPDADLSFRAHASAAERAAGNAASPRETSIAAVERRIQELDQQAAELKKQTPEGQREIQAEKQRVLTAHVIKRLEGKTYSGGHERPVIYEVQKNLDVLTRVGQSGLRGSVDMDRMYRYGDVESIFSSPEDIRLVQEIGEAAALAAIEQVVRPRLETNADVIRSECNRLRQAITDHPRSDNKYERERLNIIAPEERALRDVAEHLPEFLAADLAACQSYRYQTDHGNEIRQANAWHSGEEELRKNIDSIEHLAETFTTLGLPDASFEYAVGKMGSGAFITSETHTHRRQELAQHDGELQKIRNQVRSMELGGKLNGLLAGGARKEHAALTEQIVVLEKQCRTEREQVTVADQRIRNLTEWLGKIAAKAADTGLFTDKLHVPCDALPGMLRSHLSRIQTEGMPPELREARDTWDQLERAAQQKRIQLAAAVEEKKRRNKNR